MRLIAVVIIIVCSFSSLANAQRALAIIEGYCNEEFEKSKKPESEREAYFETCFKRKRAENERAAASSVPAPVGPKASFDCAKAKSGSARLICSDPALSEADRELGETFRRTIAALDAAQRRAQLEEQVKWIRERNTRCGLDNKQNAPLSELKSSWQCTMDALLDRKAKFTGDKLTPSVASQEEAPSPASLPPSSAVRVSQPILTSDAIESMFNKLQMNDCRMHGRGINGSVKASYASLFLNDAQLSSVVNYLWRKVKPVCDEEIRLHGVPPGMDLGDNYSVSLVLLDTNENWDFSGVETMYSSSDGVHWKGQNKIGDLLRSRQQEQRQAQAIQTERQHAAQIRETNKARIIADLAYEQWVAANALAANPFVYKGRVVGIYGTFGKMMSESDAIFSIGGDVEFYVSGVPSTMFRGNENVILSSRIVGTKTVKSPLGEVTLPYGEYVRSYKCVDFGCREVVDY